MSLARALVRCQKNAILSAPLPLLTLGIKTKELYFFPARKAHKADMPRGRFVAEIGLALLGDVHHCWVGGGGGHPPSERR